MRYDVASKVVVELAKENILSVFLGMKVESAALITELPEETPSLRRSDYALWVQTAEGEELIVLLEFQTYWKGEVVWRLLDSYARTRQRYRVPVVPVVLVFHRQRVKEEYDDGVVRFRYRVVRLWEMEAREILQRGLVKIYPFVPVMASSREEVFQAEEGIYQSAELERSQKSDLLTALAIFAGMRDKSLAEELVERRRDLMIESPTYDMIKEEGIKEGLQQGIQQGLQQGIQQGQLEDAREMVSEVLEERFGVISPRVVQQVRMVSEREILRALLRRAIRCRSLEEFEGELRKALEE